MNTSDVMERIKHLAEVIDWKDKRILYFVSNTEQATLFLNHVNLSDVQIRLVRDRGLSMFCNFLSVGEKVYPVKNIKKSDFLWADEVVLMVGRNASQKFLEKYAGYYVEETIRIYDTPYESLQKIYTNMANEQIEILDKHELDTEHEILENDIPFIEEPILSKINKYQSGAFFTYSMGRRNLGRGIYFDEIEIADIKNYEQFNKDTIVVVFGRQILEHRFTEESILVYKAIYGSSNVVYMENPEQCIMEEGKDYLFINAGVRMISPYFTKYFKTMREKTMIQDMIGLVSPRRTYCSEDIRILWGNKSAFMSWKKNIVKFADERYWQQYVMTSCIVAEEAMFNRMDFQKTYVNCKDKENVIGYTEWIINRMKLV